MVLAQKNFKTVLFPLVIFFFQCKSYFHSIKGHLKLNSLVAKHGEGFCYTTEACHGCNVYACLKIRCKITFTAKVIQNSCFYFIFICWICIEMCVKTISVTNKTCTVTLGHDSYTHKKNVELVKSMSVQMLKTLESEA